MADRDIRTHEVTFCSRVSKWADSIFENNPAWSFKRTEIEESKRINRKRSDLRVYGSNNQLILAGEVKLPGTADGRNAYNSALVEDSAHKASNAGAEFFFTWNVNKLVLFDSKLWHLRLPLLDAVVGNPPYVRQELIPRRGQNGVKPMQAKEDLFELCSEFWPNLKLSGRRCDNQRRIREEFADSFCGDFKGVGKGSQVRNFNR